MKTTFEKWSSIMNLGLLFVVTSVSDGGVGCDVCCVVVAVVVTFGVVLILFVTDPKASNSVVIPFMVSDMDIVVGISVCVDLKLMSDGVLNVIMVDERISGISFVVIGVVISVVDDIVGVGSVDDGT